MGVLLPAMSLLSPASPGLGPLEGPEHLAWPPCQPAALGQVHLCLGGGVAGVLLSWAGQQGFQTPTLKATRGRRLIWAPRSTQAPPAAARMTQSQGAP